MERTFVRLRVDKVEQIQMNPELYWIEHQKSDDREIWGFERKSDGKKIGIELRKGNECSVPITEVIKALQKFDGSRLLALEDLYRCVSWLESESCYQVQSKYHKDGFKLRENGYWYRKFDTRQAFLECMLAQ